MVLAAIEDVDQQRHGEAAAAERGADDDVYDDPDSPRVAGVDVGDRAEPEEESLKQETEGDDDQRDEHYRGRRYQASAQRCCRAHDQPSLDGGASSSWCSAKLRRARNANPTKATSGAISH